MYGDAISRDMNYLLYSSTFNHPSDGEFAKIKQLISSDPYANYDHCNQNRNQNQIQQQEHENHGQNQSQVLRCRSSPSSFFSNLLNDNGCDDFPDPVTVSSNHEPEERFFAKNQQLQRKSESGSRDVLQYASLSPTAMKQESKEAAIQKPDFSPPATAPMHGCMSRRTPNLPPCSNRSSYNDSNRNNLESSSSLRSMDPTSSSFIRQSSSPAGFLSSLTVENGFAGMKDVRKGSSLSMLNNHISFSSGPSSSSRFLPQIAENGSELHDSTFNNFKRSSDGDLKMLQINGDSGNHTPSLVHHMSLPKTSSEMAAVENFLQFQQESSVPWKTRAKRGFATHPRSIAERVRRTRISERIKRLQELFPDLDKQTNTADMLDMAVDYIKDLQKELQILNEARARCTCSNKQLHSGSSRN